MTPSKQMEEECLDGEGTNLTLGTPGFEMLLSLLMICAILSKTLAAKSLQKQRHLKWELGHFRCRNTDRDHLDFQRKSIFMLFHKRKHRRLIFFCPFLATTSAKKKIPGTPRQHICSSAERKVLVNKSLSFNHTHSN